MLDAKTSHAGHGVAWLVTTLAAVGAAVGQTFLVTVACSLIGGLFGAWLQHKEDRLPVGDFLFWVVSGLVIGVIFGSVFGRNTPGDGWEALFGFSFSLGGTGTVMKLKALDWDLGALMKRILEVIVNALSGGKK